MSDKQKLIRRETRGKNQTVERYNSETPPFRNYYDSKKEEKKKKGKCDRITHDVGEEKKKSQMKCRVKNWKIMG